MNVSCVASGLADKVLSVFIHICRVGRARTVRLRLCVALSLAVERLQQSTIQKVIQNTRGQLFNGDCAHAALLLTDTD